MECPNDNSITDSFFFFFLRVMSDPASQVSIYVLTKFFIAFSFFSFGKDETIET